MCGRSSTLGAAANHSRATQTALASGDALREKQHDQGNRERELDETLLCHRAYPCGCWC
jgi:hypothetical protein